MATSAVSAPLAQLPNALTVLRLVLIPAFVAVYLGAGDGSSWGAGWIFLVAGVTDQVDGYLARRWRVESRFGRLADPLADRLMIDVAAILLALEGKLPWVAAVVIVGSQIVDPPPAAGDGDPESGAWLGLAGSLLMAAGALLSFGRLRFAVTVEGRDPRQRVAAVDTRPGARQGTGAGAAPASERLGFGDEASTAPSQDR